MVKNGAEFSELWWNWAVLSVLLKYMKEKTDFNEEKNPSFIIKLRPLACLWKSQNREIHFILQIEQKWELSLTL